MEFNQAFTAPSVPKLNRRNISSPLSSSAAKISSASPKPLLKKSNFSFAPRSTFDEKSIIKPSTIEDSEKTSRVSSVEQTLVETNKILVEIQKQLSLDFAMRIAEEKEKNASLKEEKSKRKFALKESSIESVNRIDNIVKSVADKVLAPVKSAFDKLIEFITTLGLGIGVNAVFKWLENEENREKLTRFFNIIKENGTLVKNILKTFGAIFVGRKILGALSVLKKAFLLLGSPAGIAAITALSLFKIGKDTGDAANRTLEERGIDPEKAKVLGSEENIEATKVLTEQASNPLTGGMLVPTLVQQQLGPDGKPKERLYEGKKKVDSVFNVPLYGGLFRMLNPKGYQEYLQKEREAPELKGKAPEARKMGGPVKAGNTYLVGEQGPELVKFSENGQVINNMKTEKIYQMISSKRSGRNNFVTMDLPPQVIKKEKSVPTPPTPSIPNISSTNAVDLWRVKTPDIYGIYV